MKKEHTRISIERVANGWIIMPSYPDRFGPSPDFEVAISSEGLTAILKKWANEQTR